MRDGTDWHPTRLYQPGLGIGTPVERVQLGYAKTTNREKEKLASDLAKLIQVPVPHVEIAPVQRLGRCAISHVHSSCSRALTSKEDFSERAYSPAERAALKQASACSRSLLGLRLTTIATTPISLLTSLKTTTAAFW